MDPKAAAKAKRSHTVRGRRAHQTPAAAAAHRQKRAESAASVPRSRDLPSNWDRYADAVEADAPSESTGEVAPRSKGADFAFLLEQARAQPRDAAPGIAPQDSPFGDFMQASASMLEAKGEEILSWRGDDNFILEDDLAPDFEVPFLSMDLHALATHLSKLKLSERLFLENDLLPEDLAVASEVNQIQIQCGTDVESDAKGSLVHQKDTGEDKSNSEGAKFEVVSAEEELDMLLNTLGGTHLSGSNLDESFGNKSALQDVNVNQPYKEVTPSILSKSSLVSAPSDDALDNLLSETSPSIQNECFAEPGSTTSNDGHNIDIRYANQIDITTSIDDLVDDLFTDTSLCLNGQKQASAQGKDNISKVSIPLNSGPSNASDDFDSWFDSL
uniref:Uncharacterized protein n=1 Tax=Leersia perrieri TaxID=77586 RepID=A0A0D9WJR4_9ORYZ